MVMNANMTAQVERPVPEQRLELRTEQSGDQSAPSTAETIYLIGRSSPERFLRFVKREGVDPVSESDLIDEWRAAQARIRELRRQEAGFADDATVGELGDHYESLLIEFLQDPLVRHGFNTVPTEVGMVELDRLVVYQNHIDLAHVARLVGSLERPPDWQDLFRICLPYDHPTPPVAWSRSHDDRFVFHSPSNDLRFLGAIPLERSQVVDCPPTGVVVGVVGITVGFGSNFLNAIKFGNRLILNNGSHRAFALRQLGITHVPCVVQHASSRLDLRMIAPRRLRRSLDSLLEDARPAVLKDYFDERLRTVVRVHRRVRQVTVRFDVDETYVPAL
jgi:hypothetical protein